jgi:hypothetical protein
LYCGSYLVLKKRLIKKLNLIKLSKQKKLKWATPPATTINNPPTGTHRQTPTMLVSTTNPQRTAHPKLPRRHPQHPDPTTIFAWPLRFRGSLQSKTNAELQSWVMAVSILKPNVLLLHARLHFFSFGLKLGDFENTFSYIHGPLPWDEMWLPTKGVLPWTKCMVVGSGCWGWRRGSLG